MKQKTKYRRIFQDIGYAKDWLPDTMYISDYWDGNTMMVANFDEDIDFSTTTLKGGRLVGKTLKEWREEKVKMKYVGGLYRAVRLDWDRATTKELPSYAVILSDNEMATEERSFIVFSMADREEKKLDAKRSPLDLSAQVEDRSGNIASLPLSSVAVLLPMLEGDIVKWPFTSLLPTKEPIFQNFAFQLADFKMANLAFQPENLSQVRFIFDKTKKGSIYLSDIGIRENSVISEAN
ncbi:hypothetical protein P9850_02305 [Anoxybacillus rupiensis]|uniref:Uncharacterized protein n=1 Tax=Anoxybacteroides rupiense TaxID=311460 RepID=A0ABD5IRU3_9BACL|nr:MULTISPECIES: hypothetical protein [Anoxybacillus]MED5050702.1 hypothetical protein [Anoxybacillus rupiensis]